MWSEVEVVTVTERDEYAQSFRSWLAHGESCVSAVIRMMVVVVMMIYLDIHLGKGQE